MMVAYRGVEYSMSLLQWDLMVCFFFYYAHAKQKAPKSFEFMLVGRGSHTGLGIGGIWICSNTLFCVDIGLFNHIRNKILRKKKVKKINFSKSGHVHMNADIGCKY